MVQKPKATEWSELLEATRFALSTLRLEDLEKLSARAEEMLEATAARHSPPPAGFRLTPGERRKVLAQQRMLGNLLAATDRNLVVARHLCGGSLGPNSGRGLDSRWVR
jgi:hypothetical protein